MALLDRGLDLIFIDAPQAARCFREHIRDTGADLIEREAFQDVAPISAQLILELVIHAIPSEAVNLRAGHLEDPDQFRRPPRGCVRI